MEQPIQTNIFREEGNNYIPFLKKGIFVWGKTKKPAFTLAEGATHVALLKNKRKSAFTLAEVLITLAVIGVVAALTIPTLVKNYEEKATVTKVKKMYNTLFNAYRLAILDYGTAGEWGITGRDEGSQDEDEETYNATNAILVRDKLLKNVKTVKLCDNAKDQKACGVADEIYCIDGKNIDFAISSSSKSQTASALLADGSTVVIIANGGVYGFAYRGPGELSNTYANIYYDINGTKSPNTYGKDIFLFYVTENSIIPCGSTNETKFAFANNCYHGYGVACTAWVIYNENMDYLHCDDLSWNGKHKCD